MRRNYQQKLLQEIIRRNYDANYQLVYYIAQKCGNYRDSGPSKKNKSILVQILVQSIFAEKYLYFFLVCYFLLKILKKTTNKYLRLEIRVVCRQYHAFKYVFIYFF